MALDAGSVFTVLGGRFSPAAFEQFDAANKKAVASATAAEAQMSAAGQNVSEASPQDLDRAWERVKSRERGHARGAGTEP